MNLTRLCACLLCALLLSACADVQPRLTQPSDVVIDQNVESTPLRIYVSPRNAPMRGLSVVYLPFRVSQNMEDPRLIGSQVMGVFWETWMEKKLFATQVFLGDTYYYSQAQAAKLGREKGADLVVTGEISHFLDGGSNSDSAVSLRVDVIDSKTGELVWSMAEAGRMERVLKEDYVIIKRTYRLPNSAVESIVRHISEDMAVPVREWSDRYGFATNADEIVAGLAAPRRAASQGGRAKGSFKAMEYAPDGSERAITETDPLLGVNLKVEFDFDKWNIRPDAATILNELGKALRSPELAGRSFTLRGHTDNYGTDEYNMRLSLRRANSVKNYLVKNFGLDPARLKVQGFGESMPIASNDTPEGRQLNRRVEVVKNP
ncbi:OmpA/MotB domain protein [Desulfovibrio sp. X2]|uniref:OmpA family protein n=1 Tax=Desulfovibrio sp. X2 TaxID=941449 RepID=UPI000358BA2E|nr:OmpA family protein [Desulfovibrio sp. X2]EPR44370.1 OmpA/MotB domain protein [Desulfovibrio sp. X2]